MNLLPAFPFTSAPDRIGLLFRRREPSPCKSRLVTQLRGEGWENFNRRLYEIPLDAHGGDRTDRHSPRDFAFG
jgi:hypothetical protein